jgi:hypothetical protein
MSVAVAAVIGQVLTFLTVIAGFIFQYLRETRQHKWEQDQRIDIAHKALATQEATAKDLATKTAEAEARLAAQIENNTEVSRSAFREANDVNNKIHALGLAKQLVDRRVDEIADFVAPKKPNE